MNDRGTSASSTLHTITMAVSQDRNVILFLIWISVGWLWTRFWNIWKWRRRRGGNQWHWRITTGGNFFKISSRTIFWIVLSLLYHNPYHGHHHLQSLINHKIIFFILFNYFKILLYIQTFFVYLWRQLCFRSQLVRWQKIIRWQ